MQQQPPIKCGRGKFYYLYLIEDIYSRKAVGWEVYEAESGEKAAAATKRDSGEVLATAAGASLRQRRADEIGNAADQDVRLGHHAVAR